MNSESNPVTRVLLIHHGGCRLLPEVQLHRRGPCSVFFDAVSLLQSVLDDCVSCTITFLRATNADSYQILDSDPPAWLPLFQLGCPSEVCLNNSQSHASQNGTQYQLRQYQLNQSSRLSLSDVEYFLCGFLNQWQSSVCRLILMPKSNIQRHCKRSLELSLINISLLFGTWFKPSSHRFKVIS